MTFKDYLKIFEIVLVLKTLFHMTISRCDTKFHQYHNCCPQLSPEVRFNLNIIRMLQSVSNCSSLIGQLNALIHVHMFKMIFFISSGTVSRVTGAAM